MGIWQQKATKGKTFAQAPEGTHPAACVGLVDLGTHEDVYKGKAKENRKVLILFELLTEEVNEDGSPFILAREFTAAFSEGANVRKFVESWRGKKFGENEDFDFLNLLEKNCLLTVEHSKPNAEGKFYASVNGVAPPMKGMVFEKAKTTPLLWAFDMGTPYPNPEWVPRSYGREVSEIIAESKEARGYAAKSPEQAAYAASRPSAPAGRVAATVAELEAAHASSVAAVDDDSPF